MKKKSQLKNRKGNFCLKEEKGAGEGGGVTQFYEINKT
jgi:hypothetical protein